MSKQKIAKYLKRKPMNQQHLLNTINYYTMYHEDYKEIKSYSELAKHLLYARNHFNYSKSFGPPNNTKR